MTPPVPSSVDTYLRHYRARLTDAGARRSDADSNSPVLIEPRVDDRDTRYENDTTADSDADTLREEHLPVCGAET